MRRNASILFAILLLGTMNTVGAVTKYVGTSSMSGNDYTCDGTNDEVEINQALAAVSSGGGGTVYLKGAATYVIGSGSVKIGSNTTLTKSGSSVIVKLKNSASWAKDVPIITQLSSSGNTNITVYGFEIDGNAANNLNSRNYGQDYYDALYFKSCTNVSVHDMYIHQNLNDALCTSSCKNVDYYNNTIYLAGHEGYYGYNSTNIDVYGNNITIHTNSGVRLDGTDDARIYQNTLHTPSGGGGNAGVQIACASTRIIDSVSVYENTIYDTNYAGMWIYSSTNAQTNSVINIYNNTLYNCGVSNSSYSGGIVTCGFNVLIERNTFDGCHGSAVSTRDTYASGNPAGGPYWVTVRNNIIVYSTSTSSAGAGYGIWNSLSTMHNPMKNQTNCYYGNAGTNYYGSNITTTTVTLADPLFYNRSGHDYHLKSTVGRWNGSSWTTDSVHSPCIDAGTASSGYGNEPEPNGNQVNIGRWANTAYASKSNRGYKPTVAAPVEFGLSQNVPNPFNPLTTISYTVAVEGMVTLKVYSASGQLVGTLVDEIKTPGSYSATWAPKGLASGVYFCKLQAGNLTKTNKMVFMK